MTDDPLPPDETNDYGRYSTDSNPTREDQLWSLVLDLVEQSCGVKGDLLDSWAISAYERAIEALAGEGFVEMDAHGRIGARILPKARRFQEWIELHSKDGYFAPVTHAEGQHDEL